MTDVLEVLQEAADAMGERSSEDALYGRLMCRLVERHPRATWGQQCQRWADHYASKRPQLATWLLEAARKYEALALSTLTQIPPQSAKVIPLMAHTRPVEAIPVEDKPCAHEHMGDGGFCHDCGVQVEVEAAVGD